MLYQDLVDIQTETWGGYTPAMPPAGLPPGASPLCQDVIFPEGAVKTRPGIGAGIIPAIAGGGGPGPSPAHPSINYLKTFTDSLGNNRMLYLDAGGGLWQDFPVGVETLLHTLRTNMHARSTSLFGREYLAFSDGQFGKDLPFQYDTANLDRVSQVGPGAPPVIADISQPLVALSRSSGVIAGTTSAPSGLVVGGLINITGMTLDSTFNGQWPVVSVSGSDFTAWNAPGQFVIATLTRAGGNVMALLATTPTFIAGADIVIAKANDPSFNGGFSVVSVSGNTVTWAQGGTDALTSGGFVYSIGNTVGNQLALFEVFSSSTTTAQVYIPGNVSGLFVAGGSLELDGCDVSGFNGTYVILSVTYVTTGLPPFTQFTSIEISTGALLAGVGHIGTVAALVPDSAPATITGVAGPAGNIVAGIHQFAVSFITRQGFITKPSPIASWSATGGFTASVTAIPQGPTNILARLLMFTVAGGGTYFYLAQGSNSIPNSAMLIADNITNQIQLDFSDAALAAGASAQTLFNLVELGECAGVIGYNNRLFWWAERNKVQNFNNLTFNGGFNPIGDVNLPLGWSVASGFSGINYRFATSGVWQNALSLIGDGVNIIPVTLAQTAYQDSFLVPIILPNTAYSMRIRIQKDPLHVPTQGNVNVALSSASTGASFTATVGFPLLTSSYQEFIVSINPMGAFDTIPADLQLQLFLSNTPNNGGRFNLACLEIFPTNEPNIASQARGSYVNQPEGYDGVTGLVQIRTGDGQTLRAAFPLRNNLYFGKDNYLCYVTDDGKNEPAFWSVNEISSTIGICGPDALDFTEEWAVFVHKDSQGVYITFGSDPIKINQEIAEDASNTGKLTFASINWAAAFTIWVRIDQVKKRILVGVPVNGATSPNAIFAMDYKFASTAESITAGPGVVFSSFSGKLISHGGARKWSPWNITAPSCGLIPRPDGTNHTLLGGQNSGTIYDLLDVNLNDNGLAINGFYQGTGVPAISEEQMLQLRGHNKLCGGVTGRVTGSGTIPGIAIETMTNSSGVVSVLMSGNHGFATGNYVLIGGALDTTFNGIYQIIVTGPTTFTYRAFTKAPSTAGAFVQNTFSLAVMTTTRTTVLRSGILTLAGNDFERACNIHGDRFYFQVGTNAVGAWFQLERLCPLIKPDPTMPVRGVLS